MENNSTLEQVLLVWNRNAKLLPLVGVTFDSKVAFLRRMRKKNLITLQIINKEINSIKTTDPPFFVSCLLTFELSNINGKCLENCNMLTERTLKFLLNIITI